MFSITLAAQLKKKNTNMAVCIQVQLGSEVWSWNFDPSDGKANKHIAQAKQTHL